MSASKVLKSMQRVSQWQRDQEQLHHAVAIRTRDKAEAEAEQAKLELDAIDQHILSRIGQGSIDVTMWTYAMGVRKDAGDNLLVCEAQAKQSGDNLQICREGLLAAQKQQELYMRLMVRKQREERQVTVRHQQNMLDDLGMTRGISVKKQQA